MTEPALTAHDPNCLFCKITAGQIPSRKVYEDDTLFAFHDIRPAAPVHFLIVPKQHIPSMAQVRPSEEALLGKMMALAPQLALERARAWLVWPAQAFLLAWARAWPAAGASRPSSRVRGRSRTSRRPSRRS